MIFYIEATNFKGTRHIQVEAITPDEAEEKAKNILDPDMQKYFTWAKLSSDVLGKLEKLPPDVIFCNHFDALSAAYPTTSAPVMAWVGDLCHLPIYYSWRSEKPSFQKYLIGGSRQILYNRTYKKLMLQMLEKCAKRGAFAAHYADWIRRRNGFSDTLYLRTPAHDPLGESWEKEKQEKESASPFILIIGDIGTTSTSYGIEYIFKDVIPRLDREYGADGYKLHLVGGGKPQKNLEFAFNHPAIVLRGRVVPAEPEFLHSNVLLVPTPINLGIRVRVITAFSLASCVVAHTANAEGVPEMKHEENCLLADSGPGLAKQVVRALKEPSLRKRLGQNARITYENYFSEQVAGERIVKEMEKIGMH